MKIIKSQSPNFDGREGFKPKAIVIHCTEGTFPYDLNWLKTESSQVSSHYLIAPTGEIHNLVEEENAAWHTGRVINPTWDGFIKNEDGSFVNPNKYTIGIELSLLPPAVPGKLQYSALLALIQDIAMRHNIPLDRKHIIGHKEIRANKSCPGTINVDTVVKDIPSVNPSPIDKEDIKKQIISLLSKL